MNAGIAGLTTLQSGFSTKETMDRLESEIRGNGMEVFARIDHAAGATKAGAYQMRHNDKAARICGSAAA